MRTRTLSQPARRLSLLAGGVALLLAVFVPSAPKLGPPFTAPRSRALTTADSMLAARGVDPSGWTRLSRPVTVGTGQLASFLESHDDVGLAPVLAAQYDIPAWWIVRYVHTSGTLADRAEEWRVRIRPDGAPLDVHHLLPDSVARDSIADAEAREIARTTLAGLGFDTLALEASDLAQTARPHRRDVTVTYTDTTLDLPAGAQAKVAVTLAGREAVQVQRSVDLPETFQRAERERADRLQVIMILCGVLFLAVVVVGGIRVGKRLDPVLSDGILDRRTTLIFVGSLTALGLASFLNTLKTVLASYDTAMPWRNFLGLSLAELLAPLVAALIALALWYTLGALRRRAGIRLFPDGSGRAQRRDMLLAGLGAGALFALADIVPGVLQRTGVPAAPTTLLGRVVPALGTLFSVPVDAVMAVTTIGIPLLVVVGAARSTRGRALTGALLFLPLLGLVLSEVPRGTNIWLAGAAFVLGALAFLWLILRYWAPYCGWSWVLAVLIASGFRALRHLVHAPTLVEQGAGLVTLLGVIGLVALAMRFPRRAGETPSRLEESSMPAGPPA